MRSNQMAETLLPKRLALPIYCSDAISSNAYATQEILLVLALGGAAMVLATPWVALVVVGLLGLVTLSYQQTCHAYPNGGGAYAVSKANLGRSASLIAAAALLVDYVIDGRGVGRRECGEPHVGVPCTPSVHGLGVRAGSSSSSCS